MYPWYKNRDKLPELWASLGSKASHYTLPHLDPCSGRGKYFVIPLIASRALAARSSAKRSSIIIAELHNYSGAPGAQRDAKRSPIIIEKGTTRMHRNRNPCNSFLMVKMACGMDHGRVRPTTTTTTTNDVTQHGGHPTIIPSHAVLDYSIYRWY